MGIVQSRQKSWQTFEKYLHLPQDKLSGPVANLWHTHGQEEKIRYVVVYENVLD